MKKLFQKIIIKENERGLMFKNGKFERMLEAGEYQFLNKVQVEIVSPDKELISQNCSVDVLLKDEKLAEQTDVFEVKEGELGFRFVNGFFVSILRPNKYVYWNVGYDNKVMTADITKPEVDQNFPKYLFKKISTLYYNKIEVKDYEKCMLFYDGKFQKLLNSGTYYFWIGGGVSVTFKTFDMRLTNMAINGQEVLTQDKVTLRVNLTVNYKIKDCMKIYSEIGDCSEQLHIISQLALRDFVGKYKLDEILTSKNEMSDFVLQRLKEKENDLYIEIAEAGVKDMILPGEIRDIMNTVLIAEKRAQASVITRREEVASTRSLLNTAKLMDENKTLYKLKELEYIERICENVENLNIGGGAILNQLTKLVAE